MSLRYLCLTDRYQQEADIDTWWSRIVGDRTIWGPGLDGWDADLSIDQNLLARFGGLGDFDAVFLSHAFSSNGHKFDPPSPAVLDGRPTVAFLHEVLGGPEHQSPTCDISRIDVVLHAYAETEMDPYVRARTLAQVRTPGSPRARQIFRHVPHHVRCDLFHPPDQAGHTRDIDVLLVGRYESPPGLYPLRHRWARLIEAGRWPNAMILPTPYGVQQTWTPAERDAQLQHYVATIHRAQIVVACSSRWRYMLGKFTELAACDTFFLSDVATGLPPAFTDNMGVVSAAMSDDELVETANYWLREREERERRTRALGTYVREHLNMDRFWEHVDEAVGAWKA